MRRDKARAHGPYRHGKQWRVHFVTGSGANRATSYETFATRAAAEACVEGARSEAQGVTVSQAISDYIADRRAMERKSDTLTSYEKWLRTLLAPLLTRSIRSVSGRGAELYLASTVGRRADTHRNFLGAGRRWGTFCVKKRWITANPFAGVDALGARAIGADKVRLTVDESRVLVEWCREHPGDQAAVLTLGYLLLGPRTSELIRRDVRDLDDGGQLLLIGKTKTLAGSRKLRVPDELAELLRELVAGRAPDAPIFTDVNGQRMSRDVARRRVRAVCTAAGVTVVSPQALRRTQSTLATEAGETGLAVARHLGHATGAAPQVTGRSYVGRDAARNAQVERGLRVIRGGAA